MNPRKQMVEATAQSFDILRYPADIKSPTISYGACRLKSLYLRYMYLWYMQTQVPRPNLFISQPCIPVYGTCRLASLGCKVAAGVTSLGWSTMTQCPCKRLYPSGDDDTQHQQRSYAFTAK